MTEDDTYRKLLGWVPIKDSFGNYGIAYYDGTRYFAHRVDRGYVLCNDLHASVDYFEQPKWSDLPKELVESFEGHRKNDRG